MQARFLLGPAGSGKTFRCLAEIRAALRESADGPPLMLLAPKQATFQLERQLLAGTEISGYTRLQILSFERLARFVLETFSVAPAPLLSDEGRVMVLRALLLRHEDELKLFRRSARRPGFAQEISALLNEFQQHQFTPAKLRALAGRGGLQAELRDKLHDLALLVENYARWLTEHELHDANHLLDAATEALRAKTINHQPSTINFAALWLDGFAEMTPQELDLLAATIPRCERATLAFCLESTPDDEPSRLSIWSAIAKTFQSCRARLENLPDCEIEIETLKHEPQRNRFAENPVLAVLEKSWALPNQVERQSPARREPGPAGSETGAPTDAVVRIANCASAEAEAVFAAREILKFVHAGNRFRDCAVLVRDLEDYHQPLARIFRRYEVPFFLDRRESVAHHPLAELTRSALRTVAFDWRHDDWFAALKAGFCPVAEEKIDGLENAALEFGWRDKKWRELLPNENFERLRRILFPPFEKFHAQLAKTNFKPDGAQLADALRELWDELGVEKTLQRWSSADTDQSAIRNPQFIRLFLSK